MENNGVKRPWPQATSGSFAKVWVRTPLIIVDTSQTASSVSAGKVLLQTSTGGDLSVSGKADFLKALGLTTALQDTARSGAKRKHVARSREVGRPAIRIDGRCDRVGSIVR